MNSNEQTRASSAILDEIRLEHAELRKMRSDPQVEKSQPSIDELRTFAQKIADVGRQLGKENERQRAQSLLDYWTSEIVGAAGYAYDPVETLALEEYDPEAESSGLTDRDREQLQEKVKERRKRTREHIRLAATARQWRASGNAGGYLLRGSALNAARQLDISDEDVVAFIAASVEHENATTQSRIRNRNFVIFLLAAVSVVVCYFWYDAREQHRIADKKNEEISGLLRNANEGRNNAEKAREAAEDFREKAEKRLGDYDKAIHFIRQQLREGNIKREWLPDKIEGALIQEDSKDQKAPDRVKPESITTSGYEDDFLGTVIALPTMSAQTRSTAYEGGKVLNYTNYSLAMNQVRRIAIFAASNFDRDQRLVLPRLSISHPNPIQTLSLAIDGARLLVGAKSEPLRLLNGRTGKLIRVDLTKTSKARIAKLNDSGTRFATGASDGSVDLWNATTGTLLKSLPGHSKSIRSIFFSLDGMTMATRASDGSVRVWNARDGEPISVIGSKSHRITRASFSPDGTVIATGALSGAVELWDWKTGTLKHKLEDSPEAALDQIWGVQFSPDGTFLAARSKSRMARLWNITTGKLVGAFGSASNRITRVTISRDSKSLATASKDGSVKLYDTKTGSLTKSFKAHDHSVWYVRFGGDGTRLVTRGQDRKVKLWNVQTGELVRTLGDASDRVIRAVLSYDGTTIATSNLSGQVSIYRSSTGKLVGKLQGHTDTVWRMALSKDGKRLATGADDGTVRLWNAGEMELVGKPVEFFAREPIKNFASDHRLPDDVQPTSRWFKGNPLQRGHLADRNEISWGASFSGDRERAARKLDATVNVFTNVAPQWPTFNTSVWKRLERWVQREHNTTAGKVSIFTGPILSPSDPKHFGVQIPQQFWKIAVSLNLDDRLIADSFIVRQSEEMAPLNSDAPYSPDNYRVPIKDIEDATGLNFGSSLRQAEIETTKRRERRDRLGHKGLLKRYISELDKASARERIAAGNHLIREVLNVAPHDGETSNAVTLLAQQLVPENFRSLSENGQFNVLAVLRQVPQERWDSPAWTNIRSLVHLRLGDLRAAQNQGAVKIGPKTRKGLDELFHRLSLSVPNKVQVDIKYAGISKAAARDLDKRLQLIGWGPTDPSQRPAALGRQEILYRETAHQEYCNRLAGDLHVSGFAGVTCKLDEESVSPGRMQAWIHKATGRAN